MTATVTDVTDPLDMQRAAVRNQLIDIIAEHLGVPKAKVIDTARLVEDLGCDSLDGIELVHEIEEVFALPDRAGMDLELRLPDVKTFGDMVSAVNAVIEKHKIPVV